MAIAGYCAGDEARIVLLEVEHSIGVHTRRRQRLPHLRRHRAQILAR